MDIPKCIVSLMVCSAALCSYTHSVAGRHGAVLWVLLIVTDPVGVSMHHVASR